jgi:hypothetical protein
MKILYAFPGGADGGNSAGVIWNPVIRKMRSTGARLSAAQMVTAWFFLSPDKRFGAITHAP